MEFLSSIDSLRRSLRVLIEVLILLKPDALLCLSALSTIYFASHASLSRPSTAKKPQPTKGNPEQEDDDKLEIGMRDALFFPLIAGTVLVILYLAIVYGGAQLLNRILVVLMFLQINVSCHRFFSDASALLVQFVCPTSYLDRGECWVVDGQARSVKTDGTPARQNSLPGRLGRLDFAPGTNSRLWRARDAVAQNIDFVFKLGKFHVHGIGPAVSYMAMAATITMAMYTTFYGTPWHLMNLQGIATTYLSLGVLAPNRFLTVTVLLAAMFFYDIYMVFYTPMMVTVATQIDVPVKMVFPKSNPDPKRPEEKPDMMMLGLGDVLLPGILCAMALRFDLWLFYLRKQTRTTPGTSSTSRDQSKRAEDIVNPRTEIIKAPYQDVTGKWGMSFWQGRLAAYTLGADPSGSGSGSAAVVPTFPKTYFLASLVGYSVGMLATLVVIIVWRHAQPALLYLCPGVLGATWLTALVRGEVKLMLAFGPDAEGPELDAISEARKLEAEKKVKADEGEAASSVENETEKGSETEAKDPSDTDNDGAHENGHDGKTKPRFDNDDRFFVFRLRTAAPGSRRGLWMATDSHETATSMGYDKRDQ